MRKQYNLSVEVEFTYDPETVDPFYWINPATGKRSWRMEGIYGQVKTEEDIWRHLAYNAIFNGVDYANRLDGWADLPSDAITMTVRDQHIEES